MATKGINIIKNETNGVSIELGNAAGKLYQLSGEASYSISLNAGTTFSLKTGNEEGKNISLESNSLNFSSISGSLFSGSNGDLKVLNNTVQSLTKTNTLSSLLLQCSTLKLSKDKEDNTGKKILCEEDFSVSGTNNYRDKIIGKSGNDLIINVPEGNGNIIFKSNNGETIAILTSAGELKIKSIDIIQTFGQ